MASPLNDIDVVVLAGGLGTRLRSVLPDAPKVLAPVRGRPFLDHLLDALAARGFRRAVLSIGYKADMVEEHLRHRPPPLPAVTIAEPEPLGTGGAVRFVASAVETDPVLVINGDTWVEVDFQAFLAAHRASGAMLSTLCVRVDDTARFGRIDVNAAGRITRFAEKDPDRSGPGLINGGAYLLSRAALDTLAVMTGPSLESDFLACLPPGTIHAFIPETVSFIDIGTPETLAGAGAVIPGI
ncbi:MAG: nucleotidyltransferase family protein [Rhodospirillaceae bacterium]